MSETLGYVPGRFKVIRHVREVFSCRTCETTVQVVLWLGSIFRPFSGPRLVLALLPGKNGGNGVVPY